MFIPDSRVASKTVHGFSSLGVQDCFLFEVKLLSSFKQFCTPRAGKPGNVLLTSRIRLKYFYQWTCTEKSIYVVSIVLCRKLPQQVRNLLGQIK